MYSHLPYSEIWLADFEFQALDGERPTPHCSALPRELRSNRLVRALAGRRRTGPPALRRRRRFVVRRVLRGNAELGCGLALDWPAPVRILDLFAEFRCLTNDLPVPCGNGLLGALAYFGLPALDAAEKRSMRELAIRGGPFTAAEQTDLLDYCQSDVDALARLLPAMIAKIDLRRALLRGRYMAAAARMERNGVPIDTDALARIRDGWERIKGRLIAAVDADYSVFVPTGQRVIDPQSHLGAALTETAREYRLDVHRLAEAVDYLWRIDRDSTREGREARRAARQQTGLTARRIDRWEDAGGDYSTYPNLDVDARELAGTHPAAGIGTGYQSDSGYDETDYSGQLWEVLREQDERIRPRHDPSLLRDAAELIAANPDDAAFRPMTFSTAKFADYLKRKNIPWPRLPDSDALALDNATFKEMAKVHPAEIGPIRELRHSLSQLRLNELAVGSDGRNRAAHSRRFGRRRAAISRAIRVSFSARPVGCEVSFDRRRGAPWRTVIGRNRNSASPRHGQATRPCNPPTRRATST